MCTVIAISNQKGGVGKTTTTTNIAQSLKHKGYRVLVIDFDPQGNLSFSLGVDNQDCVTIYEVLKGILPVNKAIQKNGIVDVLASNILLSSIEVEFTQKGREFLLNRALEPVKDRYDFIFIDTPPSLSILTVNAFVASDYVLIPLTPDIFSLQGVSEIYQTVSYIKSTFKPSIKFLGMFLNKFNSRSLVQKEIKGVCEMLSKDTGIPLLETTITNSTVIVEAQSMQVDIIEYSSKNRAVKGFVSLSEEVLRSVGNVES
ncbi:MAG: ParA family protein [Oscillospiraceae bacterium]